MRRLLLVPFVIMALLGWLGISTAVQDPRVVRYRVPVAGLGRPVRIVQLTDIHFSWIDMPPERLRRIIATANALHPDLVVLTGDFAGAKLVDWPRIRLEDAISPLGSLRAPLGVFAMPGNHDDRYWIRRVFARTPVRVLAGRGADLGPITLVGVDDLIQGFQPVQGLRAAVAAATPGKPVVVAAHEPDFLQYMPSGVSVFVAGHTHGGQIAPFGLTVLRDIYRQYRRGVYRVRDFTMIVSSGLGTTAVPLRIGVPPELVEITLVPAPPHSAGRNSGTER